MPGLPILLLDDDRDSTELMRRLLANAGFKGALKTAPDAASALRVIDEELAASAGPSIVIVDLSLPGMHGFDAVREIRLRLRDAFIAVMSASDNPDDIHAAFTVGADAYLEKFPSAGQLADIRRHLLERLSLPQHLRIVLKPGNQNRHFLR
ncbi:MAG TPA: response regulator [Opitutaceae bacterium]|nr:response regulator [Opitutaceae bacterium]